MKPKTEKQKKQRKAKIKKILLIIFSILLAILTLGTSIYLISNSKKKYIKPNKKHDEDLNPIAPNQPIKPDKVIIPNKDDNPNQPIKPDKVIIPNKDDNPNQPIKTDKVIIPNKDDDSKDKEEIIKNEYRIIVNWKQTILNLNNKNVDLKKITENDLSESINYQIYLNNSYINSNKKNDFNFLIEKYDLENNSRKITLIAFQNSENEIKIDHLLIDANRIKLDWNDIENKLAQANISVFSITGNDIFNLIKDPLKIVDAYRVKNENHKYDENIAYFEIESNNEINIGKLNNNSFTFTKLPIENKIIRLDWSKIESKIKTKNNFIIHELNSELIKNNMLIKYNDVTLVKDKVEFLVKITPNLFSKTSIVEIEIKNNITKHYQEKKEFINLKLDATKLTLDWSKALEAYKKSLQNNKLTLINYESKKLINNLFFNYENKSFAKNTNEIDNDFKLEKSEINYAKNEITLTISANAYVNQDGSNFKNTYKIDHNQLPIDLFNVTFDQKKLSDNMKSKNLIIDKNIIAKFFVDIKHDESIKSDIVFSYKEQILEKSLNEKILKQIEFKVDSFSIDDNSFNLQLLLNGNDKDFVNIFSKTIKMQNATIYLTNNLTFGTKEEQFKSFQKAFGNDLNQRVIVEHFNIHPKYPGWTLKNVLANIIKGCDFKITNKTGLASTSFKPYWAEAINTQQIKWSLNSNQFVLHFRFNNIKKTNKEFYLKKIVFTFEKTNFGELRDMEKNPLKSIEVLDSN